MAGEKALFSAREVGLGSSTGTSGGRKYMEAEKRRYHRRSNQDRRAEVRFDLNGDRRQNRGRRDDDITAQFW